MKSGVFTKISWWRERKEGGKMNYLEDSRKNVVTKLSDFRKETRLLVKMKGVAPQALMFTNEMKRGLETVQC